MDIPSIKRYSKIPLLHFGIASFLQHILNKFFYQEVALKSIRVRLIGKVLSIDLKELSQPLIFICSEKQVNVVNQCSTPEDCMIKTRLVTLLYIKNIQQFLALINDGTIVIVGDMEVVQNWYALLDAAEWNFPHYFAPYVGDFIAEVMSCLVEKSIFRVNRLLKQQKKHFKNALVEEWQMFPNRLEVLSFINKIDRVVVDISGLEQRLSKLEEKYETGRN
ncbi:MAG: ubiquinone biosynthesis accessory factor UbiJ [Arsenophonus sp. NC-WZS1-MAG3]